ncbi:hypothetical protein AY599_21475 [Leptolyngbya valderiana BDU 20041]|nr:hypothetical protein AY599_21475 [Leptolyngbya valderiana BDU 20041]
MPRKPLLPLRQLLEIAERLAQLVAELDRPAFESDELRRAGVAYLIQNLGEAARRVPEDIKARHPQIPWHLMVGMRHRLVHEYFRVDAEIVWKAAAEDLPPLIPALRAVLSAEEDREEGSGTS